MSSPTKRSMERKTSFCYAINAILQTDQDTGNLHFQVWHLVKNIWCTSCCVIRHGQEVPSISINTQQKKARTLWGYCKLCLRKIYSSVYIKPPQESFLQEKKSKVTNSPWLQRAEPRWLQAGVPARCKFICMGSKCRIEHFSIFKLLETGFVH